MLNVTECEQHAQECRQVAARTQDAFYKKQSEDMAEAWTMLARERRKQLEKQKRKSC